MPCCHLRSCYADNAFFPPVGGGNQHAPVAHLTGTQNYFFSLFITCCSSSLSHGIEAAKRCRYFLCVSRAGKQLHAQLCALQPSGCIKSWGQLQMQCQLMLSCRGFCRFALSIQKTGRGQEFILSSPIFTIARFSPVSGTISATVAMAARSSSSQKYSDFPKSC